jgi:hypothetical protein
MSYYKHYKRTAALRYVSPYVLRDHSFEQMPYDTRHNGMAVFQRASGHVPGDDPFQQMPY